jgi:hypothetical protein
MHHVANGVTRILQYKCFATPLTCYDSDVQFRKSKCVSIQSDDTCIVLLYYFFEVYKELVH